LLESLADMLRRTVDQRITIRVEATDAPACQADPVQLESALLNLCLNARDAMPAGGRLELSARRERLSQEASAALGVTPGDYLVFGVQDNGGGMSAQELEHALEPFFTTKPEGRGSGLGLSTAFGFARQSGGQLVIRSSPGEGAAVTVYLPVCEAPAEAQSVDAPTPAAGPMRILLVEDDDLVRGQVARQLRALGHEVQAVADGQAALDGLFSEFFDLMMTDVVMPGGMNGPKLAEQARVLRPDLPVLFTSGYTSDMVDREGRLGPRSVFLPKPYRRAQLVEALDAALRAAAAVDETAAV